MPITMYQASAPVLTRVLTNLSNVLGKAAAHAEAKKINPSVLISARLYPDMLPFSSQIQIATDHAKGCVARLAGMDPPRYEDTETTFPDLVARIKTTLSYIATIKPAQIDGSEERPIRLKLGTHEINTQGQPYLLNVVLPNVYFHVVTAYAILRHNGVDIGKTDFLGKD